jgi:uncharacterized protein (TIGR03435 family)
MGVVHLFQQAYELKMYQVTGADPMSGDRFNIIAKIPEGATREQFRQMQQQLLAERFAVTFHKEQKEMPVYELVVGKNGPKLKESGEETATDQAMPSGRLTAGADGFPEIPPGRSAGASMNGKMTNRVVRGTMSGLAAMLSGQVGRPVIDKTGLAGRYDYVLKWVMQGRMAPPPGAEGGMPADPDGPSITSAIQEQLGLRLEASKGRVEVYVIDSFAKTPTQN